MKNIKVIEYIKFGLAMVVLYAFFSLVGIGCPIKFLTGISCPGCGMTRAWIRLLHLDIKGAFYYHPLFFVPAIYIFIFLFKEKIPNKIYKILIGIAVVLFITVYIFRVLNPDGTVISINIKNGFIYKIFKLI
ncbi:DUF2752 domain-containing protein [Clostridium felsineum]|uniref:DUF2752 domain-containing protein n=1 Tax=Clostridium felsineum TaxID=36839 RepID=UPI00098C06C5|nr:DUF2752 domain-containing protein [Clostridium felsineum]URZ17536.1 hypothetical protein CLFE_035890 [Clostridium felsineum DSM 794]